MGAHLDFPCGELIRYLHREAGAGSPKDNQCIAIYLEGRVRVGLSAFWSRGDIAWQHTRASLHDRGTGMCGAEDLVEAREHNDLSLEGSRPPTTNTDV